MYSLSDCRRIEILVDDVWIPAQLAQVQEGDLIRQFEPDGSPVLWNDVQQMRVTERPSMEAIPYRIILDPVQSNPT